MALPADVTTFELLLEAPTDHTGAKQETRYTITPSTEIVHPASKQRLVPHVLRETLTATSAEKRVELPHPAVAGMIDAHGADILDWFYVVTEHVQKSGVWAPTSGTRIVQPLAGVAEVNLAMIPIQEPHRDEQRVTPVERIIEARDDAERHAGNAAGSALAASGSAFDALTSAGAASGAVIAAASARAGAETAEQGAVTARTGAESARDAAATARTGAETARDTATSKASAASTSAGEAATSAAGAMAAVADARTARDQASGHASAASTSASDAADSASAAGQSAFGAAADRALAQHAKTDADTAAGNASAQRQAAETAKVGAETARDLALAGQFLGAQIPNGTNFDMLVTPGAYRVSSGSAAAATNAPTTAGGHLWVATLNGVTVQQYTPYGSPRGFYIRGANMSTTPNAPWRFIATQRINSPAGQPGVDVLTWDDVNGREQNILPSGIALAAADLNVITVPGVYHQSSSANATLARNYPYAGFYGTVQVLGSGGVLTHVANPHGNTGMRGIYIRSRHTNGTDWSPWAFIPRQRVDQTAGRAVYTWDDVNNREQLVYGDTGWRNISGLVINGWVAGTTSLFIRRVGFHVFMRIIGLKTDATNTTNDNFLDMTTVPGFQGAGGQNWHSVATGSNPAGILVREQSGAMAVAGRTNTPASGLYASLTWSTDQAWPTVLPGVANGAIPV